MRPPDCLREVAERALAGVPWRSAVRDFLDGFALAAPAARQALLDEEPPAFDEVGTPIWAPWPSTWPSTTG